MCPPERVAAIFTTCFSRSSSRRSSTSELSSSSVISGRVKSMGLAGWEETMGSKRPRRSRTLKCDSYRAERTAKSMVASSTKPKEAATSRGRRNSVAASSRGVGERVVRELRIISADMGRMSERSDPARSDGNPPDFGDKVNAASSFLSELQWVHVPAHGVGRNVLANL